MSETLINAVFTPIGFIGAVTAVAILTATVAQRRWVSDRYTYVLVVVLGPTCFVPFWYWPVAVALTLTIVSATVGVAMGVITSRGRQRRQRVSRA